MNRTKKLRGAVPYSVAVLALVAAGCGDRATADSAQGAPPASATPAGPSAPAGAPAEMPSSDDALFLGPLGIDVDREVSTIQRRLATLGDPAMAGSPRPRIATSLSDYETVLPHTTQPKLSRFERALLTAYLDHPDDAALTQYLGVHHLWQSLLRPTPASKRGEALKHTILSLYFLERARDSGATAPWIGRALEAAQAAADAVFETGAPITSDEDHDAHLFYRRTFHLNEEGNRYDALARLLQDFSEEPNNVYTSFVLTAINLWMGGEADYDDPTTLYNYALGSYFSLHTMDLAQKLELAWNADPQGVTRFRMAAELGGFSLLQRRWLAKLHGDEAAVSLMDVEHKQWWDIQPAFHSFTYGLPYFDEPAHFADGLAAYAGGLAYCDKVQVRTCIDQPRFSFNLLGFLLGYTDFLIKAGELDAARQMLMFNQMPAQAENWAAWDLGRDAWDHRVDNLDAIAALYRDADPGNDPLNFLMKSRKWGEDTTTCQECHQMQGKANLAAMESPQLLPPPEIASITNWPAVNSAWYGAPKK
jgi:hypothetical protein